MMPGGMTLTVRELEALQLKYKTQEKEESNKKQLVIKNGDSAIQWPVDQINVD